jgi:hypothetical protein
MINKSIRHSSHKFGILVNYLFNGMDKKNRANRWIHLHNLQNGCTPIEITDEFEDNTLYLRKNKTSRKRIYKYHEILSFSKESSQNLSNEKLQQIARDYLKIRDPHHSAKAFCTVHYEKKHTHLHFIISSNHIGSDRSSDMRMDNKQYFEIRREIERETLQKFPELVHSTVYLENEEIKKLIPEKYHNQIREKTVTQKDFGKQTKKQKIANQVRDLLDKSSSLNNFIKKLEQSTNLQAYYRKEKLTGVIADDKKYRLKTLGIELVPERLNVLSRLDELEKLQKDRERESGLER